MPPKKKAASGAAPAAAAPCLPSLPPCLVSWTRIAGSRRGTDARGRWSARCSSRVSAESRVSPRVASEQILRNTHKSSPSSNTKIDLKMEGRSSSRTDRLAKLAHTTHDTSVHLTHGRSGVSEPDPPTAYVIHGQPPTRWSGVLSRLSSSSLWRSR